MNPDTTTVFERELFVFVFLHDEWFLQAFFRQQNGVDKLQQ